MRFLSYFLFAVLSLQSVISLEAGGATTDVGQTWNDLRSKREALKSFHQEFEVSRTFKTGQHDQASEWFAMVDGAGSSWREPSESGSGDAGSMLMRVKIGKQ